LFRHGVERGYTRAYQETRGFDRRWIAHIAASRSEYALKSTDDG
ncbi:hypothetical protein LCGC14_1877800, partial [marine sediment metagenome]